MRLVDLNPEWIAQAGRSGQGLTFDCPGACCANKIATSVEAEGPFKIQHPFRQRLGIAFANPIDGGPPEHLVPHHDGAGHVIFSAAPEWTRTGETFEALTLHPSVDASASGHWHGWVQSGDVR